MSRCPLWVARSIPGALIGRSACFRMLHEDDLSRSLTFSAHLIFIHSCFSFLAPGPVFITWGSRQGPNRKIYMACVWSLCIPTSSSKPPGLQRLLEGYDAVNATGALDLSTQETKKSETNIISGQHEHLPSSCILITGFTFSHFIWLNVCSSFVKLTISYSYDSKL